MRCVPQFSMKRFSEFSIILCSPSAAPQRWQEQLIGQASALADFQVSLKSKPGWPMDTSKRMSLVQIIRNDTFETVGGICVQFRTPEEPLPTERNLKDPLLTQEIAARQEDNPCELCGA